MDYYKILNIPKNASAEDIKSAYKKQAMLYHPDRGGDANEFKKVNEAYQILSDPQKKQTYDQFGVTDQSQPNFRANDFHNQHFDDLFRNFGFNVNFGNGFQQRVQKNKDIKLSYPIDVIDIFQGKTETIVYKLPSGKEEVIVIKVPVGIREGNMIKFQGQGDDSFPQAQRGDLIVQIVLRPHADYNIHGNDLYRRIKVNVMDLLCGSEYKLQTVDNQIIRLKIPKGTSPNTKFNISQHGLPVLNSNIRGNLIIETLCDIPILTDEQVSTLKNFNYNTKIFT